MPRFKQIDYFTHKLGPLTETLIDPVFLSMDYFLNSLMTVKL